MPRSLSLAVAALLTLGSVAYAAHAVLSAPAGGFTFSVEPRVQSTTRGNAVRYVIRVIRYGGFSGAVTLSAKRLPRGARARFQSSDGARTAVVPGTDETAILTVRAGRRTRIAKQRLLLRGRASGRTAKRWLGLHVKTRIRRRYTLRVSPKWQRVTAGNTARFRVRVRRARGFDKQVRLWPGWFPRGWRVGFAPDWGLRSESSRAYLYVTPPAAARTRTLTFVVGSRARGRGTARRYAIARLRVLARPRPSEPPRQGGQPFKISGGPGAPLVPGSRAPLDLVLTNPNEGPIDVTRLSVAIRGRTSSAACNGTSNFAVIPYSGGYPLRLAPGSTRLSGLVADPNRWPRLVMRDLAANQDACKGIRLGLDYSGSARG